MNEISVPEQELQKLQDVKNQVTMGESEVRRLRGLANSKRNELDQMVKDVIYYEETLKELNGKIDTDTGELAGLEDSLAEAKETIEKSDELKRSVDEKKAKLQSDYEEKVDALNRREREVNKLEDSVKKKMDRASEYEANAKAELAKVTTVRDRLTKTLRNIELEL